MRPTGGSFPVETHKVVAQEPVPAATLCVSTALGVSRGEWGSPCSDCGYSPVRSSCGSDGVRVVQHEGTSSDVAARAVPRGVTPRRRNVESNTGRSEGVQLVVLNHDVEKRLLALDRSPRTAKTAPAHHLLIERADVDAW